MNIRHQGRTAIQSVGRSYVYRKHAECRCSRRGFIVDFKFCRTPETLSSVIGGVRKTCKFSKTCERMVHFFQTTARKLLTGSHTDSRSRRRWMTVCEDRRQKL